MKKAYIFALLLLGISYSLHAQSIYTIEGTVKDTVNYSFTQYTSISIINASDSILQAFTRADEKGHFTLSVNRPGSYLLLYENPRFASVVHQINISESNTDVGMVPLTPRDILLKEVVINGRQAITIKGDTIEYAADSFKTGQYDNVDALLKQLPGLEVSSDGSIKAYGQTVEKMLVDGDEFFSDDPAMVAKMLRASSVDAVQVYDKKTDEAEFTGIDDGKRIKTINLKLKDNAKRGYFGKISAGGGTSEYWQNEAMINAFKGKRKISAYAIMSNTQTGGLGFQDRRKYGSGVNTRVEDGAIYVTMGSSGNSAYGFNGNFRGQGLPKTWNTGVHYGNAWRGDSLKINGSYNLAKNNIEALNNNITQYILPDTQYFNDSHAENYNSQINHNLSFNGEYQLDSLSGLRVRANGGIANNSSTRYSKSEAKATNGQLINDNEQTQTNSGENKNINAYLNYRKKFRKKGRSFSANLSLNQSQSESKGLQRSEYHLYALDSTQKIDQRKVRDNNNQSVGLSLNYTEPLTKDFFLLFNYQLNVNNQESQIRSFNPKPGNAHQYELLDSLYSSHYVYDILNNRGGIRFQYNPKKKLRVNIGGDISTTNYNQKDLMADSSFRYHYLNFFPSVSLNFRKSQQSSFNFNYNGRSQQPSMQQLQPVRNNEDPLNIAIGNPDLKQAFHHDFRLSYYNFKVLTSQSVFVNANFSFEQNAITQKQNIDHSGRRTYQFVNVNGNYNGGIYSSFGRRIVGNFRARVGANVNFDRTHNFINNKANSNSTWSFSPSLIFNYFKDTTVQLSYTFRPSYNSTVSKIRTDLKTRYWNFQQSLDASFQLPGHFKMGTTVGWEFRSQLSDEDKQNKIFLWNGWLSRAFLRNQSLVLKAYANDILNQNVGYSRVTSANQISETRYNTIQRYFMLSLTWNFTKTGSAGRK